MRVARVGIRGAALAAVLAVASPAVARPPDPEPSPRMYVTATVTHYRPDIPNSGPITSVAVDAADASHVLVASETGGAFRSRDGGDSWQRETLGARVEDVAFLRRGTQAIGPAGLCPCALATTHQDFEANRRGGGGIYISYRREVSPYWERVRGDVFPDAGPRCPDRPDAHGIAIAPDTGTIYVATDCGLAVGNARAEFTHFDPPSTPAPITSVAALGDNHLIVGGPTVGFWRSLDGGRSWRRDNGSIPGPGGEGPSGRYSPHSLAADPAGDGQHAYAVDGNTNLYETRNAGDDWTRLAAPTVSGGGCGGTHHIVPVLRNGMLDLYYGNGCETRRATVPANRPSTNLSAGSWVRVRSDHGREGAEDTRDFAPRPGTGAPYLLTSDGGIHRSTSDMTFAYVGGPRHGLDADQVTEVRTQRGPNGLRLYFATQHNDIWAMDGERPLSHARWEGAHIDVARYAPPSGTPNRVTMMTCGPCGTGYADTEFSQLTASTNPAFSPPNWTDPVEGAGVPTLLSGDRYVEDVTRNRITERLDITSNGGGAWRTLVTIGRTLFGRPKVSGGAPDPTLVQPYPNGVTPQAQNGIPAGMEKVELLRVERFSGGATLPVRPIAARMNRFGSLGVTPTEFAWYEVLAVDPRDPRRMIAPDVFDDTVKVSTNNGDDWAPVPGGLDNRITGGGLYLFKKQNRLRYEPNASVFSYCPENSSRIMVGTRQGGVHFSFDGGARWERLEGTDAVTYATSIDWDPGCGGAYVSTYGRGIFHVAVRIHTRSVPCDAVICELQRRVLILIRGAKKGGPKLGPRPYEGVMVSDGILLAARRQGGRIVAKVTAGSIVTPLSRRTRLRVRQVPFRPRLLAGRDGAAAVIVDKGDRLRILRTKHPLMVAAPDRARRGKGKRRFDALAAHLQVVSDDVGNGSFARVLPGTPLVVRGTVAEAQGPLALLVDGVQAATYPGGTKSFEFKDMEAAERTGPHSVALAAGEGGKRRFLAGVMFQVPHVDAEEEEGEEEPEPAPTPTPTATPTPTPTAVPTFVTLTCPQGAKEGTTFSVSGSLSPPLADAPVQVHYTPPKGGFTQTTKTDATGAYRDEAVATTPGTWTIQAEFPGDDERQGSKSAACTVEVA